MIGVDKRRCKACGICVQFCPKAVFDASIDGTPVVAREEVCTYCQLCVNLCPDFALSVKAPGGGAP